MVSDDQLPYYYTLLLLKVTIPIPLAMPVLASFSNSAFFTVPKFPNISSRWAALTFLKHVKISCGGQRTNLKKKKKMIN